MSNAENNNSTVANTEGIKIGINYRKSSKSGLDVITDGFARRGINRIVLCVGETNNKGNIEYDSYIEDDLDTPDSSILLGTKDISLPASSDDSSSETRYVDLSKIRFAIKIHTKYLNEKAKTLTDSDAIRSCQKTHLEKLNGLISSLTSDTSAGFKDKIDWITDFNESPELFEWEEYYDEYNIFGEDLPTGCESFVEQCLKYLKKKLGSAIKFGITFSKNSLNYALRNKPSILKHCDVIGLNTYPPVGFVNVQSAKELTVEDMQDAISWSCVKDYIKSVLSQVRVIREQEDNNGGTNELPQFIITEVGTGEYWSMLESPADALGNLKLRANGEVPSNKDKEQCKTQEPKLKYMQAFYRYMKDFKWVDEINFWYITNSVTSEMGTRNIEDLRGWLENGN